MEYSNKFKEALLKKYFSSNSPNASAMARDAGIPKSTLITWIRKQRRYSMSEKNGSSKKLTPQQKLDFVLQASQLSETELGEFLRKNGLYSSQLELWKQEMLCGLKSFIPNNKRKKDPLKKENEQLKKEILRKDKALAEASALLILKKKANLLWGEEDSELD